MLSARALRPFPGPTGGHPPYSAYDERQIHTCMNTQTQTQTKQHTVHAQTYTHKSRSIGPSAMAYCAGIIGDSFVDVTPQCHQVAALGKIAPTLSCSNVFNANQYFS